MATESAKLGCWTCRLRHKKCDETQPICGCCLALEIRCCRDVMKPPWMDNGPKQREKALQTKIEVKRSAERRRKRKLVSKIAQNSDPEGQSDTGPNDETSVFIAGSDLPSNSPIAPKNVISLELSEGETLPLSGILHCSAVQGERTVLRDDLELCTIMSYLEYVVPVLFPFYKPFILEGSRCWMLPTILKSQTLYHTSIALSNYFFSVVPVLATSHKECSPRAWEALRKQMDLAVTMVQQDLQVVNNLEICRKLVESTHLLEGIVQLLNFEAIIAPTESWRIHIDAAIALFQQILQSQAPSISSKFLSALKRMTDDRFPVSRRFPIWAPNQNAFRFFTAVLLYNDIMSAVTLQQAPRLREYHVELLMGGFPLQDHLPLSLETILGCRNWVLLAISDIAVLASCKKNMGKQGTSSMEEIVEQAAVIEQKLQDRLAQDNDLDAAAQQGLHKLEPYESRADFESSGQASFSRRHHTLVTRVWALAAQLYLHTVVNGWKLRTVHVRTKIAEVVDLLKSLASPKLLRTFAWPLCVAGCMVERERETDFRVIIDSLGALGLFGTMRHAVTIIEQVWQHRDAVQDGCCDITLFFRIDGQRVLLI